MNKYDISEGKSIKLIEPELSELQGIVEFKPSPFNHPTFEEPDLIIGTYVVRNRKTKEYVHMSDATSYDRLYEYGDHETIKEELNNLGISPEDLEKDWEPVPFYEDQYESIFMDA